MGWIKALDERKAESLVKKGNYRDYQKFDNLIRKGKLDLQNPEILNSYLETLRNGDGSLSSFRLSTVLENGVTPQRLLEEGWIKAGITSIAIEILNSHSYSLRGHWMSGDRSDTLPIEIFDELIKDEAARTEIIQNSPIEEYGKQFVKNNLRHLNGKEDEDSRRCQSFLESLKTLGNLSFHGADISEIYGNPELQEQLHELGLVEEETINELYAYQFADMRKQLLDHSFSPKKSVGIDVQLNPSSAMAKYWQEQSQLLGEDAMRYAMSCCSKMSHPNLFGDKTKKEVREEWFSHLSDWERDIFGEDDFEEYYQENVPYFTSDGNLTDAFFQSEVSGSPVNEMKTFFYEGRDFGYDSQLVQFFANNVNRLKGSMKGLILTWMKLENQEEKEVLRKLLFRYATGGHPDFVDAIFDESGVKEEFYKKAVYQNGIHKIDGKTVCLYQLLEALEPNFKDHLTPMEWQYISYTKDYPMLPISNLSGVDVYGHLEDYFDEYGPKEKILEKIFLTYRENLLEYPDLLSKLAPNRKQYLLYIDKVEEKQKLLSFSLEQIDRYFTEEGATNEFLNEMFVLGEYHLLSEESEEKLKSSLGEIRFQIIKIYQTIPLVAVANSFKEYVKGYEKNITLENLPIIKRLLERVSYSNSSDVRHFSGALISQLLPLGENAFTQLDKIEDVFLRNNLPMVGKIFSTFVQLYLKTGTFQPDGTFISTLDSTITPATSPVLRHLSSSKREAILFADLLRSAMNSNNRSIKGYLESIERGESLVSRIEEEGLSFNDLTEEEQQILKIFEQHLITLYQHTQVGQKEEIVLGADILENIKTLTKLFKTNSRYSLSDRIVRSFGYLAGVTSFEQMRKYMETRRQFIDQRNQQNLSSFTLEEGDFIKGINSLSYLGSILQNGSNCKEFLGSSAESDATPYDTDLSRILKKGATLAETISGTISASYGRTWFVLKNDGRFTVTREKIGGEEQTSFSSSELSKLEAFATGSDQHYGIRTGFGSTEIDYIITDEDVSLIGYEIAKNGFYIPVVDYQTGKLIFTPEQYDDLRKKLSGLDYYEGGPYLFAEEFVDTPAIQTYKEQEESDASINAKIESLLEREISQGLSSIHRTMKTTLDGDLSEGIVEVFSTGSTARRTNLPGDPDFDFIVRVDARDYQDPERMKSLETAILSHFQVQKAENGLRGLEVLVDGIDTPIKMDITIIQKTDKVDYSSEVALAERLKKIKEQDSKLYSEVLANIKLAKAVMKEAGCYKNHRKDESQGGLGGIGIENWILQNGGSFLAAAKDFLRAAEGKDFEQFKKEYQVWDFGKNHMFEEKQLVPFDEYVRQNMNETGFKKMVAALKKFVMEIEYMQEDSKQK